MKTSIMLSCLVLFGFCLNLQAQNNCDEVYSSLSEFGRVAAFSSASGPASFRKKVSQNNMSGTVLQCDNIQGRAWEDMFNEINGNSTETGSTGQKTGRRKSWLNFILSLFKKTPKVAPKTDLKYSFIIATFGYSPQVDIQKIKEFVASNPWDRGFDIASHLAVDVLLMHHNDPNRDKSYNTYSLNEMKRAKKLYAN